MIKAVLSTTVLPLDGVYEVQTLPKGEIPDISGVPHYIWHPATKAIVEGLGAVPAETKLFEGLQQGEQAICFPIAQGKSSRSETGKTVDQDVDLSALSVRVIARQAAEAEVPQGIRTPLGLVDPRDVMGNKLGVLPLEDASQIVANRWAKELQPRLPEGWDVGWTDSSGVTYPSLCSPDGVRHYDFDDLPEEIQAIVEKLDFEVDFEY